MPRKLLNKITHTDVPEDFGMVFKTAFDIEFPTAEEKARETAALLCTLYLSAIKCGFPAEKLRTFNNEIRNRTALFTFDCSRYNKLQASIEKNIGLKLYDKSSKTVTRELTHEDIIDAFDFFTNQ